MFSSPELHFSPWGWAFLVCGALSVGLNKGGLTGLGILFVLIFAVVLPPRESTGFVLPLLVIGDVCAVITYRRDVIWKVLFTLLPPAIVGVVLGYFSMGRISGEAFGPVIGWIILFLIALQLLRSAMGAKLDHIFESHAFGLFMGVLAGFTTMIANAAGPVANLYFISVGLPKWKLIGTSAWFFWIINLCKVPFSAELGLTNSASLTLALILAPMVIVGFFCGRQIAASMPQKAFGIFLLVCTALGALKLVL
jgi:uncharacterized protein